MNQKVVRSKRAAVIVFAALAMLLSQSGAAVAERRTASTKAVQATGCTEAGGVVPAPAERVRPYVPPEFHFSQSNTPGEPIGRVDLFVRAYHCQTQTVGDHRVEDTTTVIFGPFVDDGESGPAFYTLFYLTDNSHIVPWMKASTGMDRVYHVPGLSFSSATAPGGAVSSVEVIAPSPSPFPFRMAGVVPAGLAPLPVITADWWSALPATGAHAGKYFRFINTLPALRASVGAVSIDVEPGSFMAELFGAEHVTAHSIGGDFGIQTTNWQIEDTPPKPTYCLKSLPQVCLPFSPVS